MSFLSKLKEQPLILLATVGITAATLGFAGGMGLGKLSNSTLPKVNQLLYKINLLKVLINHKCPMNLGKVAVEVVKV